jgi:superfamily I DNA/RNA helicase
MKSKVIYGSPGTGKTHTLVELSDEAVSKYGSDSVYYVSFTKTAALEATHRSNLKKSNVSTIHSLCFNKMELSSAGVVSSQTLKDFGQISGFKFRGTVNVEFEELELGDYYIFMLGRAEAMQVTPEEAFYTSQRVGSFSDFEFFCNTYTRWKRLNGFFDFSDMLRMYRDSPVDFGCRCLIVDEAQDLSNLQWSVIESIIRANPVDLVIVAGDDDQAIFEWSGANPHGMQEFELKYNSERIVLSQSHRIPKTVHDMAERLIKTTSKRVDKIYSSAGHKGSIQRTQLITKDSFNGDDVLVLCRNFITRKEMEIELINNAVPFISPDPYKNPFENSVAKGIKLLGVLKNGDGLSSRELGQLKKVLTPRGKDIFEGGNLKGLVKLGWEGAINVPLEHIQLYKSVDLSKPPTVRISTIHGAKGGEASKVVLHTGLTQKTIDSMLTDRDAEIRVWYVGLTRVKHDLLIYEGDNGFELN